MIQYGKQDISWEDIEEVVKSLKSDYLTQGPKVFEFENMLKEVTTAKHAFAVNSATSALHIACLALGVSPGDYVWTSPITFVASANAALYCGAKIDFVDIDIKTYNMCAKALATKLKCAKESGNLPKVIIPVHLSGQSCDMQEIAKIARQYDIAIIEDASHCIGGTESNIPIGKCQYSDITVFSFHPVKIITTAEGGAAITNSDKLATKLELYRSHGVTRNPALMKKTPPASWYYEQIDLGFNYRLTDIQAALGCSQLRRLKSFIAQRHVLADRYDDILSNLPIITPHRKPESYSAFHLYIIRLDKEKTSINRNKLFEKMRADEIGVNLHYMPVYRQTYYEQFGFDPTDFPNSEEYFNTAITIPLHPNLATNDQNKVKASLERHLCQ